MLPFSALVRGSTTRSMSRGCRKRENAIADQVGDVLVPNDQQCHAPRCVRLCELRPQTAPGTPAVAVTINALSTAPSTAGGQLRRLHQPDADEQPTRPSFPIARAPSASLQGLDARNQRIQPGVG